MSARETLARGNLAAAVAGAGSAGVTASMVLLHQHLYGQGMSGELTAAWAVTGALDATAIRMYWSWTRHRNACMAGRAAWLAHASLRWLVARPGLFNESPGPVAPDTDKAMERRWWALYPWIAEKWSLWWATGGPVPWWISDPWWAAHLTPPDTDTAPATTPALATIGEEATDQPAPHVLVGSGAR